jgi:hypothetical protein
MGNVKKAAVATAMASAVVAMVGQSGAFADVVSDAAAVIGTGTITPGLPTTGCAVQTDITFNGSGAAVGDDGVVVPASVYFNGNSGANCETPLSGQGSGTITGTFSGLVSYQRTWSIVEVFGSVAAINGTTHALSAVCIFSPTSLHPATSYALVCAAALSSTGD